MGSEIDNLSEASNEASDDILPEVLALPNVLHRWRNQIEQAAYKGKFGDRADALSPCQTKQGLTHLRAMANAMLDDDLAPNLQAINHTKQAIVTFFKTLGEYLADSSASHEYPLNGLNKCLGFVALPRSKLVMIGLSMSRPAVKDVGVREAFANCLEAINLAQENFIFKLVLPPTQAQYVLLRSFNLKPQEPYEPYEPNEPYEPFDTKSRARCAEAALAFALTKAGRFNPFLAKELGVVTVGNGVWRDTEGESSVPGFEVIERNRRYTSGVMEMEINGAPAYVDLWQPCTKHCAKYLEEMRAVAASCAGFTLVEPIFEEFRAARTNRNP